MFRVERYPWQRLEVRSNATPCHVVQNNATPCHVVQSNAASCSFVFGNGVICRFFVIFGYHPCSIRNGTGKLNMNIIYSKCHKRWDIVLVLILDKQGNSSLLNYSILAVFLEIFCRLITPFFIGFSLLKVKSLFFTFDLCDKDLADDRSFECFTFVLNCLYI